MLRKILQELVLIRKELQAIRRSLEPMKENCTQLDKSTDFAERAKKWLA